jgi:hypothetical protein
LQEGAPGVIGSVEGERSLGRLPFGHPDPIEVFVGLLLEDGDFVLGEGRHGDALDTVAELAVDAAAVRADEHPVSSVHVDGTLFAAIGAFLVRRAPH